MRTGQLKTVELVYLESLVKFSLLDAGRFEVDGPLPLVRYLYGKELEGPTSVWSSLVWTMVFR